MKIWTAHIHLTRKLFCKLQVNPPLIKYTNKKFEGTQEAIIQIEVKDFDLSIFFTYSYGAEVLLSLIHI